VKWLSLFPLEMERGDFVFDKWLESIEPVEGPDHCMLVFEDDSTKIWPLAAPVRVGRRSGWEDESVNPKYL
jgi:hypothetical protein